MAQHFAPEEVSGAILGAELTHDLQEMGYDITFITCAPNYPAGQVYPGYKNRLISWEVLDGVSVIRTWSYISPKKSFWRRILNYGTFSISAFFGGLFSERPDIILSFSPPLPLGISAWVLSRVWHVPWILNVMDIYPEVAIATGALKNKTAISVFQALERFIYRKATHIEVISDGFRKNLLEKGVPESKISIVPVWADSQTIQPSSKENLFRQKYGLSGKFVVMHAGNFGVNNSLEDILEVAELLNCEDEIRFVMVGEGEKKEEIAKRVKKNNLSNVLLLPYQPRQDYGSMLAAADLGLVSLSADAHHTSFPSKTFNIMASGRPILAITPLNSEISDLIHKFSCGVVVEPHCINELANEILRLRNNSDQLSVMENNGRKALEENYSRPHCIALYDQNFKHVLSQK